jgi:hypothetical protein
MYGIFPSYQLHKIGEIMSISPLELITINAEINALRQQQYPQIRLLAARSGTIPLFYVQQNRLLLGQNLLELRLPEHSSNAIFGSYLVAQLFAREEEFYFSALDMFPKSKWFVAVQDGWVGRKIISPMSTEFEYQLAFGFGLYDYSRRAVFMLCNNDPDNILNNNSSWQECSLKRSPETHIKRLDRRDQYE